MKRNTWEVKLTALLFCLLVPIMMLYCTVFIGTHKQHHCTGEACPICHQIHVAESIIKQFESAPSFFALSGAVLIICLYIEADTGICLMKHTLVFDKVRMDD